MKPAWAGSMRRRLPVLGLALALWAGLSVPSHGAAPPDGWRIRLEASLPGLVDKGRLTLGASPSARNGYDDYDDPHPPELPSGYLDLVTRHDTAQPGWETQPQPTLRYRAQYDAALGTADRVMPFLVETDQTGVVTLTWSLASDLELGQHFIALQDGETGEPLVADMRAQTSYQFTAAPGSHRLQVALTGGRAVFAPVASFTYQPPVPGQRQRAPLHGHVARTRTGRSRAGPGRSETAARAPSSTRRTPIFGSGDVHRLADRDRRRRIDGDGGAGRRDRRGQPGHGAGRALPGERGRPGTWPPPPTAGRSSPRPAPAAADTSRSRCWTTSWGCPGRPAASPATSRPSRSRRAPRA